MFAQFGRNSNIFLRICCEQIMAPKKGWEFFSDGETESVRKVFQIFEEAPFGKLDSEKFKS